MHQRTDGDLTGVVVGIVGAGTMGAGIAQVALEAGHEVILHDVDEAAVEAGLARVRDGLARRAARLDLDADSIDTWVEGRLAGLRATVTLDAVAAEAGLVTFSPDDIDWEDEVRLGVEARAAFSPDVLTGLEANLRFAGPETMETKIFGRLTAWQNWIFQRPNAVGEKGALRAYGQQGRPEFDWRRT